MAVVPAEPGACRRDGGRGRAHGGRHGRLGRRLRHDGRVSRAKVLSTPDDYSEGIVEALAGARRGGLEIDSVSRILHGTTVATNALLEGKGARVALLTTRGFRDVLEIRRLRMPVHPLAQACAPGPAAAALRGG